MKREAVFAGRWYPGDPDELQDLIQGYLAPHSLRQEKIFGVVSPHAGYVHSGAVAASVFGAITVPERVVLLCPNHRDRRPDRPAFAVASHESWETPLGTIQTDLCLSEALVKACEWATLDDDAHELEHAIELQLPFLKYLNSEVKIVAISVGTLNLQKLRGLGDALGTLIGEETLLVASSDMTHFEPRDVVLERDQLAFEKIKSFDGAGLLEICKEEKISMCGRGPVVAILEACKSLGANKVELLCHDTSKGGSEKSAPVVGYAALAIF